MGFCIHRVVPIAASMVAVEAEDEEAVSMPQATASEVHLSI